MIAALAEKYVRSKVGKDHAVSGEFCDQFSNDSGDGDKECGALAINSQMMKAQMSDDEIGIENGSVSSTLKLTQRVIATRSRKYISVKTKRELMKNSESCCEYQSPKSGRKCGSKFQLQIDHITPVALGGKDEIKNLHVLCRTHNLLEAERLGLARQKITRE